MKPLSRRIRRAVMMVVPLVIVAGLAEAQEAKSVALAKQLVDLLNQKKLDSIAAPKPGAKDEFVGALVFPTQLLVVSARYSVPVLLTEKLGQKDYRGVYIDLNSASVPESKVFVDDLGANGLKAKREEGEPFDSIDSGGKTLRLDSDWKKQKMSEDEYMKAFADADAMYSAMLSALIAELKKTS
ncbi:MAG: hypothetical protein HYZ58_07725 [Acidobacteria bacterium]|nr:hypothetical protein [Acidobacteriota bacterium]MBI3263025.1 hypothetical protein [Acidobacteriota bacterium]